MIAALGEMAHVRRAEDSIHFNRSAKIEHTPCRTEKCTAD